MIPFIFWPKDNAKRYAQTKGMHNFCLVLMYSPILSYLDKQANPDTAMELELASCGAEQYQRFFYG